MTNDQQIGQAVTPWAVRELQEKVQVFSVNQNKENGTKAFCLLQKLAFTL